MGNRHFATLLIRIGTLLSAAAVALVWWNGRLALGILAGVWWNVASLWCLAHLFNAWLGSTPSRRRAIGWLLAKFPLLYVIVFAILRAPTAFIIGFGLGFSAVLICAMGSFALNAQPLVATRSHGH